MLENKSDLSALSYLLKLFFRADNSAIMDANSRLEAAYQAASFFREAAMAVLILMSFPMTALRAFMLRPVARATKAAIGLEFPNLASSKKTPCGLLGGALIDWSFGIITSRADNTDWCSAVLRLKSAMSLAWFFSREMILAAAITNCFLKLKIFRLFHLILRFKLKILLTASATIPENLAMSPLY